MSTPTCCFKHTVAISTCPCISACPPQSCSSHPTHFSLAYPPQLAHHSIYPSLLTPCLACQMSQPPSWGSSTYSREGEVRCQLLGEAEVADVWRRSCDLSCRMQYNHRPTTPPRALCLSASLSVCFPSFLSACGCLSVWPFVACSL